MTIGIIAAVPLELKHLVRTWVRVVDTPPGTHLWTHTAAGGHTLVAACAGMGAESARKAFALAETRGPLDLVLSVGLAGATDPALPVATVAVFSETIDSQTGERFSLRDGTGLRIASGPRVADRAEKHRLLATYGVAIVDMEAATIARMAQQRGIPMCCLKAVSDAYDAILPDINPFLRDGHLRIAPFLANVAIHPGHWGALIRLGRNSAAAAKALGAAIDQFLLHTFREQGNRPSPLEAHR